MARPNPDNCAIFDRFVDTFQDINVHPAQALVILDEFQVTDDMRARLDLMAEWDHWTEAARAAAALNYAASKVSNMPVNSKEHIGDTYARYFMHRDAVAAPRYNLCIALAKFATHQVFHAFARTEGLPYPDESGSRAYSMPGPALEEAMFGQSKLEKRTRKLFETFRDETAKRVGFDMSSL